MYGMKSKGRCISIPTPVSLNNELNQCEPAAPSKTAKNPRKEPTMIQFMPVLSILKVLIGYSPTQIFIP